MRFKNFYIKEGRNKWEIFEIKRCDKRWTFRNTESGKINYIKIDSDNEFGGMQRFLTDVLATPGSKPKTQGKINYHEFASDVLTGKKSKVYIKSGKFEQIQKTWILPR